MRGYQLTTLFGPIRSSPPPLTRTQRPPPPRPDDAWSEMKIGLLAKTVLRQALQRGIGPDELANLQQAEYSNEVFGINFPLLVPEEVAHDRLRYYTDSVTINGQRFLLCSQWYENPTNNDRPLLVAWLHAHDATAEHGQSGEPRETDNL